MTVTSPMVHLAAPAGDDAVRPFQVDGLDVRGRAVQMGPALDALLERHDYPAVVSKLVAEAAVLTSWAHRSNSKANLSYRPRPMDRSTCLWSISGRQGTSGRMLVSTPTPTQSPGRWPLAKCRAVSLLGRGTLAMTIDQGGEMTRYQGIVALEGGAWRKRHTSISANRSRFQQKLDWPRPSCWFVMTARFASTGAPRHPRAVHAGGHRSVA